MKEKTPVSQDSIFSISKIEIARWLRSGEVLFAKDISDLMREKGYTATNIAYTLMQPQILNKRGFPNSINPIKIGISKYRGKKLYFDASLEVEQIDFDSVILKIDAVEARKSKTPKQLKFGW